MLFEEGALPLEPINFMMAAAYDHQHDGHAASAHASLSSVW